MGFLDKLRFAIEGPLLDKDTFNAFLYDVPGRVLHHAEKSTFLTIDICNHIKSNPSDDYKRYFFEIYYSLYEHLWEPQYLETNNYEPVVATIAKFYHYYLRIMPIVLRGLTAEKKHFSTLERKTICEICFEFVSLTDYEDNFYLSPQYLNITRNEWATAANVTSDYDKVEAVLDYHFIFTGREGKNEILPAYKSLTQNEKMVFWSVMDKNFVIFYKALRDYIGDKYLKPLVNR